MSQFRMWVLALVLASVAPRCGARAVLSVARLASSADGAARGSEDEGRPSAFHSQQRADGGLAEERHDFVPIIASQSGGSVPFGAAHLAGFAWAGLVAATPLLLRYLDRRPITHGVVQAAGALCIVTVLGMYFCTNVVLFRSTHFDDARSLTIIESIYFMSQVITTVGYGDIVPAKPNGQLLVGCYVLCALCVIGLLFAELVQHVQGVLGRQEAQATMREETSRAPGDELEQVLAAVAENSAKLARRPSPEPLVSSLLFLGVFACTWVLFFCFWPGEEKTWVDALFMSTITLSTVGLGAVTPSTEAGMMFAAFWMLLGGAALAGVVTDFVSFVALRAKVVRQDPRALQETFDRFSASLSGDEVTEADFIRWGLMQQGLVAEDDLGDIKQGYSHLAKQREVALQC